MSGDDQCEQEERIANKLVKKKSTYFYWYGVRITILTWYKFPIKRELTPRSGTTIRGGKLKGEKWEWEGNDDGKVGNQFPTNNTYICSFRCLNVFEVALNIFSS